MTKPQVDAFFADYVAAFMAKDVDRICRAWKYPAFMAYEGRQQTFDAETFRSNAIRLLQFYTERGMARAEKDVADIVPLTASRARCSTS